MDKNINKPLYIKDEYKYSEITGKIIGCAIEVHKILGNGFQEVIYQRALEIEMSLNGFHFKENLRCLSSINSNRLAQEELISY
jgi:GxxExxY protein